MKPEHDTVPNAAPKDNAEPGEARLRASERPTDPPPSRRRADDATIPDPVDVERLILSLDRRPSPPAPIPEERPSSDGGRFVAYRGTSRPAAPRSAEETRRKALAELSVMVNATPVPPEGDGRTASTARLHRRPLSATRTQVIWALVAAGLTLAAVVSVIAVTTRSSSSSVESPPAALVVAPTGATLAPVAPSRVTLPPLTTSTPAPEPAPGAETRPGESHSVEPRAAVRASSRATAAAAALPTPASLAAVHAPGAASVTADPVGPRAPLGPPAPATSPSVATAPARSASKSAFDRW
ncbi:MAG TPA: hypothetical protein VGM06_09610 [Polyangiaceae bacterium]|jgi:hypothetical protein